MVTSAKNDINTLFKRIMSLKDLVKSYPDIKYINGSYDDDGLELIYWNIVKGELYDQDLIFESKLINKEVSKIHVEYDSILSKYSVIPYKVVLGFAIAAKSPIIDILQIRKSVIRIFDYESILSKYNINKDITSLINKEVIDKISEIDNCKMHKQSKIPKSLGKLMSLL